MEMDQQMQTLMGAAPASQHRGSFAPSSAPSSFFYSINGTPRIQPQNVSPSGVTPSNHNPVDFDSLFGLNAILEAPPVGSIRSPGALGGTAVTGAPYPARYWDDHEFVEKMIQHMNGQSPQTTGESESSCRLASAWAVLVILGCFHLRQYPG